MSHLIEPAASGRAKCRGCQRPIQKDELRFGERVPNPFADGETIMRIGDPGDSLLLLLQGAVRVDRPGRSLTLREGELIGEIEVLDPGRGRIATITAEGAVRCLAVSRADLVEALEREPKVAPYFPPGDRAFTRAKRSSASPSNPKKKRCSRCCPTT